MKDFELFTFAGFTEYESKILSVLSRESATAREICKASDIPYTKVFSVINNLSSRGFVQSGVSRPKLFASFFNKKEIVLRQVEIMRNNISQLENQLMKRLK